MQGCIYCHVADDGRATCEKLHGAEVTARLCGSCPVRASGCVHLRATIAVHQEPGVVVRFGDGRTETWAPDSSRVQFVRAGCMALCKPLDGPRECYNCPLREHWPMASVVPVERIVEGTARERPRLSLLK